MRTWPASHPKARLMNRKRDAILAAARRRFLASGYDATSMETIAAEAGVSIMTLYRHARSKDELFEAIITITCDPEQEERGMDELARLPLGAALTKLGRVTLDRLTSAESIAMLRAVIAETGRFPHLGELAYRGVVGRSDEMLKEVLRAHPETVGLKPQAIEAGARVFVERLFSDQALRLLLGMPGAGEVPADRAAKAADAVVAALGLDQHRKPVPGAAPQRRSIHAG